MPFAPPVTIITLSLSNILQVLQYDQISRVTALLEPFQMRSNERGHRRRLFEQGQMPGAWHHHSLTVRHVAADQRRCPLEARHVVLSNQEQGRHLNAPKDIRRLRRDREPCHPGIRKLLPSMRVDHTGESLPERRVVDGAAENVRRTRHPSLSEPWSATLFPEQPHESEVARLGMRIDRT